MLTRLKNFLAKREARSGNAAAPGDHLATVTTPQGGTTHRERGNAFLQNGQLAEAAECYRKATLLDRHDADAFVNLGFVYCEMQRFAEAESALRQALSLRPHSHDAWYFMGTVAEAKRDFDGAIAHFTRALDLKPDFDFCRRELSRILFQVGKTSDARVAIDKGLLLNPRFADFHFYLGNLHTHEREFVQAIASYLEALSIEPDRAEVLYSLGNAYQQQNDPDAAIDSYRRALLLKPDYFEAYYNLGMVFQQQRQTDAVIESYQKARMLRPASAEAHNNLGEVFRSLGDFQAALDCLNKAISINREFAEAHNNLGSVLLEQGHLDKAAVCFRTAISFKPQLAEAHSNLGDVLQAQGALDAALGCYREALRLKPDFENAFANQLFALNYHPDMNAEDIFSAYRRYDEMFCRRHMAAWRSHGNSRDPARRLRVGYVSPDFRLHSVRHFLEPLLACHDKRVVEVYAYAELKAEDATTARYRHYADCWVPTLGLSDDQLAERIRADGIDILVDLAGHTAGNRLKVFSRKPAPVSVSWLGYGYTTGLTAVDYLLTDMASAPAGSEGLFSEDPWRLATPAYVYRPAEGMGDVSALPATTHGLVTFGTLTRAVRINHRTIRVWSEILNRVPNARLVLDSRSFADPTTREGVATLFFEHGVSRERLEIGYHSPPWEVLRRTDIGLDCFPHNSGTTLFEMLYMGVPCVTLAGRPSVGRLGSAILEGVGHEEWIAATEEAYVEKAVALASDLSGLASIRGRLRGEMAEGPLMDEAGFARKVEAAYRGMWVKWCKDVIP